MINRHVPMIYSSKDGQRVLSVDAVTGLFEPQTEQANRVTELPSGLFWEEEGRYRFLSSQPTPSDLGPVIQPISPIGAPNGILAGKEQIWLEFEDGITGINQRTGRLEKPYQKGKLLGSIEDSTFGVVDQKDTRDKRLITLEGAHSFTGQSFNDLHFHAGRLGTLQLNQGREIIQIISAEPPAAHTRQTKAPLPLCKTKNSACRIKDDVFSLSSDGAVLRYSTQKGNWKDAPAFGIQHSLGTTNGNLLAISQKITGQTFSIYTPEGNSILEPIPIPSDYSITTGGILWMSNSTVFLADYSGDLKVLAESIPVMPGITKLGDIGIETEERGLFWAETASGPKIIQTNSDWTELTSFDAHEEMAEVFKTIHRVIAWNELVFLQGDNGRLIVYSQSTKRAKLLKNEKIEAGFIGEKLCLVEAGSNFSIVGSDHLPEVALQAVKSAAKIAFSTINEQPALVFEKTDSAERFALTASSNNFTVKAVTSLSGPQDQFDCKRVRAAPLGLRLHKRQMSEDGCFLDKKILTLEDGRLEPFQISLANGEKKIIHTDQRLNHLPGTLRQGSDILVRPADRSPLGKLGQAQFLSDVTIAIRPDTGGYYSISKDGSIWRWRKVGEENERARVQLPQGTFAQQFEPSDSEETSLYVRSTAGGVFAVNGLKATVWAQPSYSPPQYQSGRWGPLKWTPSGSGPLKFTIECRSLDQPGEVVDVGISIGPQGLESLAPEPVELPESTGVYLPFPDTKREGLPPQSAVYVKLGKELMTSDIVVSSRVRALPRPTTQKAGHLQFDYDQTAKTWRSKSSSFGPVSIKDGRFNFDRIKSCSMIGKELSELLICDPEGSLIRYAGGAKFGAPSRVSSLLACEALRQRNGVLYGLDKSGWHQANIRGSDISWSVADISWNIFHAKDSKWRVAGDLKSFFCFSEEMRILRNPSLKAIAFPMDLVSIGPLVGGEPSVFCSEAGSLVYRDGIGDLREAGGSNLINQKFTKSTVEQSNKITWLDTTSGSTLEFPRRREANNTYRVIADNIDYTIPLELAKGYLAHQRVKNITSLSDHQIDLEFWAPSIHAVVEAVDDTEINFLPENPTAENLPIYEKHNQLRFSNGAILKWAKIGSSLEFDFQDRKGVHAPLGKIHPHGLNVDHASQISPVSYAEGLLTFEAGNQAWRSKYGSSLQDLEVAQKQPIGKILQANSDEGIHWASAKDPSRSSGILQAFTPGGKVDIRNSFHLSDQKHLTRSNDQPVDMTLFGKNGSWDISFNRPSFAAWTPSGGHLLLDESRSRIAEWGQDGKFIGSRILSAPTHIFRNANQILMARVGGQTFECNGYKEFRKNVLSTPVIFSNRCFQVELENSGIVCKMKHDDSSSDLQSVSFDKLPGTRAESIGLVTSGTFAFQDQYGIRTQGSNSHQNATLPAKGRLKRHFGTLYLCEENRSAKISYEVDAAIPLRVQSEGPTLGSVGNSKIQLFGSRFGPPASGLEFLGTNSISVATDQASVLATDQITLLHADGDDAYLLLEEAVLRVGDSSTTQVKLTSTATASILRDNPEIGLSLEGLPIFLSHSDGHYALINDPEKAEHLPQSGYHCIYHGGDDDWSVYRNSDNLISISRPVQLANGQVQKDEIPPEELFKNGQLSFDHVIGVTLDEHREIVVHTLRGLERLNPESNDLLCFALGQFPPLPDPDACEIRWPPGNSGPEILTSDRSVYIEFPERHNLNSKLLPGSLPMVFEREQRLWFVTPTGVTWHESAPRWSPANSPKAQKTN